jgi:hypothetical protein
MVSSVYAFVVGLILLSPALVQTVFGYTVKDEGPLLVAAAGLLSIGVLAWGISGNVERYGGLAPSVMALFGIFIVLLVWGWLRGIYTPRNIILPLLIDIVLVVWIWSARPKS